MHPYKMVLLLVLFGSALLFTFLVFSYTYSLAQLKTLPNFQFPRAFYISTLLILSASFIIHPSLKRFLDGEMKQLKSSLWITLILGLTFTLFQLIGWRELILAEVHFDGSPAESFLYVISGLHGLHVIGALTYLVILIWQTQKLGNDPIKLLVAQTNPYWRLKYELLTMAWHFLDALWIILFFYFLFSL